MLRVFGFFKIVGGFLWFVFKILEVGFGWVLGLGLFGLVVFKQHLFAVAFGDVFERKEIHRRWSVIR